MVPEAPPEKEALRLKINELGEADLRSAYGETVKQNRVEMIVAAKEKVLSNLGNEDPDFDVQTAAGLLKDLEKDIVRGSILATGGRIDGRDTKTVRPIAVEVGVLPELMGVPYLLGERRNLYALQLWAPDKMSRLLMLLRVSIVSGLCCIIIFRRIRLVKLASFDHLVDAR